MARAKCAKAGTHPLRLRILKLLEEVGPMSDVQISRTTGASLGSVQWHLYVLMREGLVERVAEGGFVRYVVKWRRGP
ncbi:MAG: winged helix-turn-helix domain-containing protein [Pyrobaculum sp.]